MMTARWETNTTMTHLRNQTIADRQTATQPRKTGPGRATPASPASNTLDAALTAFLRSLSGRNVSPNTITAYGTDLKQFIAWLGAVNLAVTRPNQVGRGEITEYLAHLAEQG